MLASSFSRGTAYTMCLAQILATIVILACFPTVTVQVYVCHPQIRNGSAALDKPSPIEGATFHMALPVLVASLLGVVFATNTMGLAEQIEFDRNYTQELLDETGLWDALFWAFCTLEHMILVAVVTTPGDAFATALAGLLVTYFLHRSCRPKSAEVSLTQENLNVLGYTLGLLVTAYSAPPSSARLTAILVIMMVDYFLGVGHTWEKEATFECIANCRLFYVCSATLCTAALYASWKDPAFNFVG